MISLPIYAFITHTVTFFFLAAGAFRGTLRYVLFAAGAFFAVALMSTLSLDDYENYASMFRSINTDKSFIEQTLILYGEYLYLFFNYVLRYFTDDFKVVRFLLLFIALGIKILFLIRWGKFYTLSFVFYISMLFYPDSYLLRSTIASSFLLLGIWALFDNKSWYRFFIPIFIGIGFHSSVAVAIPLWFMKNIKISKWSGFSFLSIVLIIGSVGIGHSVVQTVLSIFSADIYVVDKLLGYADSKYGQSMSLIKGSLLVYLPITCAFIGYQEKIKKSMEHYDLTLVIILYSLFILLAFSDFLLLSERLFRLFAFLFPIAVGHIFYVLREEEKTMLTATVIIALNLLPYITDVGPYRLID